MPLELRFALRALRRNPVFTCVAVLSLALSVGANTAIFSLMDQVLLRRLPVWEPSHLVVLHTEGSQPGTSHSDNDETVFSYPMYKDLRDHTRQSGIFEDVIARQSAPISLTYGGQTNAPLQKS